MTDPGAFAAYWRRAFGLQAALDPACAAEAVARLAPLFGPGLARAPVADLVPPDSSEAADLAFRRLLLARQTETVEALRHSGLQVLAIKGNDAARRYDPPAARIIGDLDLLVRPGDATAAVRALRQLGFRMQVSPQGALGVTSDVSFHPLVSPDGLVSVDVHTALDAYPLSAALDAESAFADAMGGAISPHHAAVTALSNAAKERFAPYAWRHLMDLARLAMQSPVDWPSVDRTAATAGLGPARNTALGALRLLGLPADRLPPHPGPPSAPAHRLAKAMADLRVDEPGRLAKVRREAAWCYTWGALARIWAFRVAGLLRPRSGQPPGWSDDR